MTHYDAFGTISTHLVLTHNFGEYSKLNLFGKILQYRIGSFVKNLKQTNYQLSSNFQEAEVVAPAGLTFLTEINFSQRSLIVHILPYPRSRRFDTSESPVALFIPEIWPTRFFVTEQEQEELAILGSWSVFSNSAFSGKKFSVILSLYYESVFLEGAPGYRIYLSA